MTEHKQDRLTQARIPESLLRLAKSKAALSGQTLQQVIADALRKGLQ